jgi:hypothetical protein
MRHEDSNQRVLAQDQINQKETIENAQPVDGIEILAMIWSCIVPGSSKLGFTMPDHRESKAYFERVRFLGERSPIIHALNEKDSQRLMILAR